MPLAQGPRQGPVRGVVGRADGGVSNVCVYSKGRPARLERGGQITKLRHDAAAAVVPRSKRLGWRRGGALERRRRRLDALRIDGFLVSYRPLDNMGGAGFCNGS